MTRVRRREADRLQREVDVINTHLFSLGQITDHKVAASAEERVTAAKTAAELRDIKDDLMWRIARIRLAAQTEDELGTTNTAVVQGVVERVLPKPSLDILELIQ